MTAYVTRPALERWLAWALESREYDHAAIVRIAQGEAPDVVDEYPLNRFARRRIRRYTQTGAMRIVAKWLPPFEQLSNLREGGKP